VTVEIEVNSEPESEPEPEPESEPESNRSLSGAINLNQLEELVAKTLSHTGLSQSHFDYYRGGACDELTLARNCQAYTEIKLWPRMLVDVHTRSMSLNLFGSQIAMPILIAPTAFQALAARSANTIMILSTLANYSQEQVAQVGHHMWYQLYVYKDRQITRDLVKKAELNGYKVLVVTVDSPLLGRREKDVRNRFHLPAGLGAANLAGFALAQINRSKVDSALAEYIASLYDQTLTWDDLKWIISLTELPVLVKGVLRAEDALRAKQCGAAGIIVSNHGGRQLDTTISTIEALPHITAALKKEKEKENRSNSDFEIFLDGGIRRGTDVLKALALGARAVMIGRPVLYALALGGEQAVVEMLALLQAEFDLAMALSGCPDLASITADLVSGQYIRSA